MIGLVIKHWRLLVDIILVIGLILAFTFWDPFDFFQQSKLRQTASLVTSVRDIGQLVTAEYYGEVIASWKDFKLNEYPEDTITQHAAELFTELKDALSRTNRGKINVSTIAEKYKVIYPKFIAFLGIHYFPGKKLSGLYDDKKHTSPRETMILKELWEEGDEWRRHINKDKSKDDAEKSMVFRDYVDSIPPYLSGFYNFYATLINKDFKKKNIVFIGRGWVKAGFDFGNFDEGNFLYERSIKTVHFYGLKAVILDQDINPWFIPQQKVKGFELVDFSSDVNFNDAKEVKEDCKKKLGEQAGTELLMQAQENGKEALKSFFSLLLNEPGLIVEFHASPYDHFLELLGADSLITLSEASRVDSMYKKETLRIARIQSPEQKEKNRQLLVRFLDGVKRLHFYKRAYRFSYYSLAVADILRDSFWMNPTDFDKLQNLRGEIKLKPGNQKLLVTQTVQNDSLWFESGDFVREFNTTIDMLSKEVIANPVLPLLKIGEDSLLQKNDSVFYKGRLIYLLDSLKQPANEKNPYLLADLQYDTGYRSIELEKLSPSDTNRLVSLVENHQKKLILNKNLRDRAEHEEKAISIALKSRVVVGPLTRFRRKLLEVSNNLRSR